MFQVSKSCPELIKEASIEPTHNIQKKSCKFTRTDIFFQIFKGDHPIIGVRFQ